MSAFFSGTDDNDDRGSCAISGVVGKLSTSPELVFRFNLPNSKVKIDVKLNEVFVEEVQEEEVPSAWLSQVKKEVYTAPAGSFRGYGAGSTGYGAGSTGYDNIYGGNFGRGSRVQQRTHVAGTGTAGNDVASLGDLTDDALLQRLGFPFVEGSEEGDDLPFVGASQGRGKKIRSKKQTKPSGKPRNRIPTH